TALQLPPCTPTAPTPPRPPGRPPPKPPGPPTPQPPSPPPPHGGQRGGPQPADRRQPLRQLRRVACVRLAPRLLPVQPAPSRFDERRHRLVPPGRPQGPGTRGQQREPQAPRQTRRRAHPRSHAPPTAPTP